MSRTFPLFAVMVIGGLIVSMLAGFLLASWALAGITPAYAAPPTFARSEPRIVTPTDRWREAGYARIGLWEEPQANDGYTDGSSRL
ncbi:hypothetical protein [Sphingomonas radiodurans]|uniref:hypothetical protein n=1 Tax=Sphingomonas radiodurans TaxID=2890321 RepID=UPI001E474284|nr:hypothetical protein [Sphingomonas radiodurans]WBH17209.1 hypothetical protein LLW23_03585 [Sphingomonas radiodurans]